MSSVKSIWMLSREYRGLAGAGGVKDVTRDLSEALASKGLDVTVVIPRYGFVKPSESGFEVMGPEFDVDMNYAQEERRERVSFWYKMLEGVRVVLVESPRFAEKLGVYTYTADEEAVDPRHKKGTGHIDYFAMNCLHQKAVLTLPFYLDEGPPCLFHCQDGHTSILPAMMRELDGYRHFYRDTGTLVTIHNAGIGYHQEVLDLPFARAITGLPWRVIYSCLLNGSFDPFLAGALYGPINTVSENYARELQETELDAMTGWLGHALKERGIHLEGVTNGINPEVYGPSDPKRLGLPAGFDPLSGDLDGKWICKSEFLNIFTDGPKARDEHHDLLDDIEIFGSLGTEGNVPLLTVVSRLSEQKGIDMLVDALEGPLGQGLSSGFRIAILGSGTPEIEEHLKKLAARPENSRRILVLIGFAPRLANLIFAAGDFFLIPSRYEPCGLTDFIAQLMGNLPIVRSTGGLVKVRDAFNGFAFSAADKQALADCVNRALDTYYNRPDVIRQMQHNAVQNIYDNYTWTQVMKRYLRLYHKACGAIGAR